ncbi:MFS general substrate transporter [Cubamyces lactineus]|nr:MFS general substrate transporter [Cubamyces lactineus]
MSRIVPPEPVFLTALAPLEHREDSVKGYCEEEVLRAAAADSAIIDDEPIVTRKELWSYYLYYNGNNGIGPFGYTVTLFQSLAHKAGYDPAKGPGNSCTPTGQCVLPWAGGAKSVNSIVLLAQGVSFAIMTLLFTTVGSVADYGPFGRWVLLVFTVLCWAAQIATISLNGPDRWRLAMALYIIGCVTYGAASVFCAAIFPRLARNTEHARELREKLRQGGISSEEYEHEESMEINRISNISITHRNIGFFCTVVCNFSVLIPLASNPQVNNYALLMFDKRLLDPHGNMVVPGSPLPKGARYATIGWKQTWVALQQYKQLPYTFAYLAGFFLLADGWNTTQSLILLCQNDKFQYSLLQNTYLALALAVTSTASTVGFCYMQRYWKISTKRMFAVTNVATILFSFWGMLGLWSSRIGYHNVWEFWAYNVLAGLFQAPYYAFSQTMMAELTPPGYDNMFFGLFGLSNRASSLIGPNVMQAIIDKSGNNWQGFPFLFALCACACLVIWFGVDVPKGRRDAAAWAERQRPKIPGNRQLVGESERGQ